MPGGTLLLGFIAAALVVLLVPGPGVLYVVARSASQGYRAGFASALGLSLGALVHVVAATAGLAGPVMRGPWPRCVSGGIYLGLGLSAALTGRRPG